MISRNSATPLYKRTLDQLGEVLEKNIIYYPILIILLYRLLKINENIFREILFYVPIAIISIILLIGKKKLQKMTTQWTVLSLTIFYISLLRYDISIFTINHFLILILIIFSLSNFFISPLFILPCFFILPQYSLFYTCFILKILAERKKLTDKQYFIVTALMITLNIWLSSNLGAQDHLATKNIFRFLFDDLFKPMNLSFFIGIFIYYTKDLKITLLLPPLISSPIINFSDQFTIEANIITCFIISLIIFRSCDTYKNQTGPINMLIYLWFIFGGLY